MTAHFDTWANRVAAATYVDFYDLERELVDEMLLISSLPVFPVEFREPLYAILRGRVVLAAPQGFDGVDAADEFEHQAALRQLVNDLHSLFHAVGTAYGLDNPNHWKQRMIDDAKDACWPDP